jgi:hypothetical protein
MAQLSLHGPTERGESLLLLDEAKESQYGVSRWKATLEALVSKVFWDGFMWELFAFLSLRLGQGPTSPVRGLRPTCDSAAPPPALSRLTLRRAGSLTSLSMALAASTAASVRPAVSWDTHPGVTHPQVYFLLTGVGAALGVFMGQLAYASGVYAVTAVTKHARGEVVPTAKTLLMGLEFAALLSAGAFLAGFTWEPVVNSLLFALAPATTDANAVFVLILVCTLFIQGTVFFVGVQGARYLFSSLLHFEAIDPPLSSHTMTYDGTLSLSIGGAQGLFVATMTFASNPLTKTFGVQSTTGPLVGSLRGGGSMVVGFLVVQTMQNIVFPASTTWADARKKGRQQLRYTREEILLPYRTPYG